MTRARIAINSILFILKLLAIKEWLSGLKRKRKNHSVLWIRAINCRLHSTLVFSTQTHHRVSVLCYIFLFNLPTSVNFSISYCISCNFLAYLRSLSANIYFIMHIYIYIYFYTALHYTTLHCTTLHFTTQLYHITVHKYITIFSAT